ncbi:hypothetical protein [Humidesulfovibrio idahonensis]
MKEFQQIPPMERWRCPDCGGYTKKIAWEKRQGAPVAHRQYSCAACGVIWHMVVDESDGYRLVELCKAEPGDTAVAAHFWDGYIRR